MSPLLRTLAVVGTLVAVAGVALIQRVRARRRQIADLRALWGRPRERERDMRAISGYHRSLAGDGGDDRSIDDRTWNDLNLDDVFARIDRTQSVVGQQALYRRMRMAHPTHTLGVFEELVSRFGTDVPARERAQRALAQLTDSSGYHLWWLARPGSLRVRGWYAIFPAFALGMLVILLTFVRQPHGLLLLLLGMAFNMTIGSIVVPQLVGSLGSFRQLGPLISAAERLAPFASAETAALTGTLRADARQLGRLKRLAGWVSREAVSGGDLQSFALEYINLIFLLDANALYLGARELGRRGPELMRVIAAVGEIDAALAVASYRAGTPGWVRPKLLPPGALAEFSELRHPLLDEPVPNSIALGPPHGLIVTGSNMSGKTTFLRTVGVAAVMAQSIDTCLADKCAIPDLIVRSVIGRADDLVSGKSYYAVEVEAVLGLVRVGQSNLAHLLLFDELFRGTNAVERIAAGEAVLATLVASSADPPKPHVVLAATHDRELVELLRDRYVSYHFTDSVGPQGLLFDYKIHPGPATTRNAIALLQQAGAPPELIERALARAQQLDRQRGEGATSQPWQSPG